MRNNLNKQEFIGIITNLINENNVSNKLTNEQVFAFEALINEIDRASDKDQWLRIILTIAELLCFAWKLHE